MLPARSRSSAWFLAIVGLVRAAAPAPLAEAIKTGVDDSGCWAYTQTTTQTDDKGRVQGETIVRFDPSKPYPEQFTPVKIDGKAPSASQLRDYRRRGEKRGERLEGPSPKPKPPAPDDDSISIGINGQEAVLDIAHATLASETAASLVYLIPLVPKGPHALPVQKLRATLQVGKERHVLERGVLELLAPLRVMIVAKIKQGELTMDWKTIDPAYPPVLTGQKGRIGGSVLFVNLSGTEDTERTDYRRVKPFGSRFGVKIGPLKSLPF